MKRRAVVLVVLMGMLVSLVPGTALAGGWSSWQPPQPEKVYLSMGTSLAAGTQADATGENILFTDKSYTDQLHRWLSWQNRNLEHVKLGCPGETVASIQDGSLCGPLYPAGNQLDQAKAVLAKADVALVTIDLGANDFLQATPDILACNGDEVCIGTIIGGIAKGIGGVIAELQSVAPDVPIVAMNYYNPSLAAWEGYFSGIPGQQDPDPEFALLTNALSEAGNGAIEAVYASLGVRVVDVAAAYRGSDLRDWDGDGTPNNVEVICALTYMCPDAEKAAPNIHPTTRGYRVIALHFLFKTWGLVR